MTLPMTTEGPTDVPALPSPAQQPVKFPTAAEVLRLWADSDEYLLQQRRDFTLNQAFGLGQQYLSWNTDLSTADILNAFRTSNEARTRVTVNKVRSRRRSLIARLTKQELVFEVKATGTDSGSLARQRVQEEILEAERTNGRWEQVRRENIGNMLDGGVSAIMVDFDPEDGEVIADDPMSGAELRFGKVTLTPMPITEWALEPGARSLAAARWWIRRVSMPSKSAQERYGLDKEPAADGSLIGSPVQRALSRRGRRVRNNCTVVTVLTHRPTKMTPGYVVHVVGGQVVEAHPWPYPFKCLNLATFRETDVTGDWVGDTFMNDARQVQVAYNKIRSIILAHGDKAGNARVLVPTGALVDEDALTDQSGEIVEYNADAGAPTWMSAPELSRWLSYEAANLEADMDDMFSTHAVTQGEAPGDRNSGLALSILGEKDDTPLGIPAKDQALGWSEIGTMVLQMIRFRLGQFEDAGAPLRRDVIQETEEGRHPFKVSYGFGDIDDVPTVRVPLDVTTPRTHAAVQAAVVDLAGAFPAQFGQLPARTLMRMLGMPSMRDAVGAIDPDEQMADFENVQLERGEPMWPTEYQEHTKHLEIHNACRKGPGYDSWSDEHVAMMSAHIAEHERLLAEDKQKHAAEAMAAAAGQMIPGGAPASPAPDMPPGMPIDPSLAPVGEDMMPPDMGGDFQGEPPL